MRNNADGRTATSTGPISFHSFRPRRVLGAANKSIVWTLVLPVPVMAVIAIIAVWFFVPRMLADTARENAVRSATQTVSQFKTLPGYYTTNALYSAFPFPVRNDRVLDDFQRAARPRNASFRDHNPQTGGFFSSLSARGVMQCNNQQSKDARRDIT